MRKIESLEAARGAAAVLVVLAHAGMFATWATGGHAPFGNFFVFGGNGVDFFFVLSGFIITKVHRSDIGRPKTFGRYAWRRFIRVYPPYWVATILSIPLVTRYKAGYRADIVWSLDYISRNIFLFPMNGYPIVSPGWSLEHEVAFYAAFGVAILSRPLGLLVGAIWTIAVLAAASGYGLSAILLQIPDAEFLLGVIVAFLPIKAPQLLVTIGLIGFFGEGISQWASLPILSDPFLCRALLGISSAFLVGGLSALTINVGKVGIELGSASYSIYLAHYPVIGALHLHHPTGSPEKIFLIYASVGVVAGMGFHRFIERPILHYLRVLVAKDQDVASEPTTISVLNSRA